MEVGQKIKLVRLHRGLTQKQLGDLLNLGDGGANRIAQYEIGYRVPKPSLLKEIAKVLGCQRRNIFRKRQVSSGYSADNYVV
ncbi:helix-turn-helix domain-containing protein [Gemmiger formicilis]|uniref:helix-turn-helix domain-containing protein n=1 Tax=Gemmiger formicilis TaxID=745368 RepID=UPI00399B6B18